MRVRSLGWEEPLELEMTAHSSILAWKIPWTEQPAGYSPWGRKESDMTEHNEHIQYLNNMLYTIVYSIDYISYIYDTYISYILCIVYIISLNSPLGPLGRYKTVIFLRLVL